MVVRDESEVQQLSEERAPEVLDRLGHRFRGTPPAPRPSATGAPAPRPGRARIPFSEAAEGEEGEAESEDGAGRCEGEQAATQLRCAGRGGNERARHAVGRGQHEHRRFHSQGGDQCEAREERAEGTAGGVCEGEASGRPRGRQAPGLEGAPQQGEEHAGEEAHGEHQVDVDLEQTTVAARPAEARPV